MSWSFGILESLPNHAVTHLSIKTIIVWSPSELFPGPPSCRGMIFRSQLDLLLEGASKFWLNSFLDLYLQLGSFNQLIDSFLKGNICHSQTRFIKSGACVFIHLYPFLFPFVLVDLESLHSDWLTGVVHETMHHAFGPWSIIIPWCCMHTLASLRSLVAHAVRHGVAEAIPNTYKWGNI